MTPAKSPGRAPSIATPGRWGQAYLDAKLKSQPATASNAPPPTAIPAPRPFKEEQIVPPGKLLQVEDVEPVRLPLKKGDQVFGRLREKDGLNFSWFIVDLRNLGLMERGEDYDYEAGEEDVPSATVEWTATNDGPWFLAFDAYRKQYIRMVAVELWRRFPA